MVFVARYLLKELHKFYKNILLAKFFKDNLYEFNFTRKFLILEKSKTIYTRTLRKLKSKIAIYLDFDIANQTSQFKVGNENNENVIFEKTRQCYYFKRH